ncbi:rhomboid family intramembrane serine protease [Luteolibacter pohnpeiensis]|uniref:Rhomboid family intramembrane serine protease n=1 Tax=Luteolibacter pohnpeiensis TaxID=454153 RepID=A0A934VX23_9BACT|nr:rhomboid family intramembrane serine protease [Luteolibacter pohnpeiensis]MBK1883114.1 rhomboid family intramembrane serine protease [Luteolibacter pohnpeiensis]
MNEAATAAPDAPIWARPEAFPPAPSGWGWVDPKDINHPCESLEALAEAVRNDRESAVCLVWTPDRPRMMVPEEIPHLETSVLEARRRWSSDDLDTASRKLQWSGTIFAVLFVYTLNAELRLQHDFLNALRAALNSTWVEICFLLSVMFAAIPWYQARKQQAELGQWSASAHVPLVRFSIWLDRQKAPVTWFILGLILLVGLAQMLPGNGIAAAGLDKEAYRQGEWWRIFTGPFLHGNPVHLFLNGAALLYLGKRLEVFARWPHLPLVFLISAWAGGEASLHFVEAPSVGASGGLMGWLGFLLIFETLHSRLVPRSARRRLLAAVFLTALIGLLGHKFIDNAAHAGGLVAGMVYAALVFPRSVSAYRPKTHLVDRIGGILALCILIAFACLAIWKISAA